MSAIRKWNVSILMYPDVLYDAVEGCAGLCLPCSQSAIAPAPDSRCVCHRGCSAEWHNPPVIDVAIHEVWSEPARTLKQRSPPLAIRL